ncbi:unnamed protein product [Gemmata massiliana]|uniref:Uncharacterized protein n=1 Tax=Gemmata massiliana TaxID=1210884 RepID=A0A6P2D4Z9_9BACT|nr:hypothetical protein [Gemmata massiliana]VTR96209.1 unnamed protein product [Gemmata massiliana]
MRVLLVPGAIAVLFFSLSREQPSASRGLPQPSAGLPLDFDLARRAAALPVWTGDGIVPYCPPDRKALQIALLLGDLRGQREAVDDLLAQVIRSVLRDGPLDAECTELVARLLAHADERRAAQIVGHVPPDVAADLLTRARQLKNVHEAPAPRPVRSP